MFFFQIYNVSRWARIMCRLYLDKTGRFLEWKIYKKILYRIPFYTCDISLHTRLPPTCWIRLLVVMSILHFTALRRRGHVRDISSVAPFCFSVLTTQIRGKAELGKGAYPKPLATRSKNWKSISEMSPRLTFFGLICHGNMILLTIFRGNWSNFFTFIALVIKPYWGFILFCILAFFPLSSCSVLNVGSSKGISKVGKIRRNLQNNWANFRIYGDLDEIYS